MCEVVVHGDDVDAVSRERIQVDSQRGDQGLAFAGLHFGDLAAMEDDAADELDVEVPHIEGALAGLAADGKRFDQEVVERFAVGQPLLEFDGLRGEIGVRELLHLRLEVADGRDSGTDRLDLTLVFRSEDLGEDCV